MPKPLLVLVLCGFLLGGAIAPVGAQERAVAAVALLPANAPQPPQAPDVIRRDATGRATIRAVRTPQPIRIDGRLDEEIYQSLPAVSDFIQQEPREGAPATERTDVWILFDADNVYVVARCWETEPGRVISNEMRRDNNAIFSANDNFAFAFDTFFDRRNLIDFEINPTGGRMDAQVTNERQINTDWNPVWDLAVGTFDGGWTVEAAIPFKSMRYRPGREQTWGVQLRRRNLWKNEWSFVTPVPNSFGTRGIFQASLAAPLVGIEAPASSLNLELKPYAVSSLRSDTTTRPLVSNDLDGNIGFDAKYAVRQGLSADFTLNTDFAQVEADEQQINLTRFSLFFPEKREFFLENQGTFSFGGVATRGSGDLPVLFYSRRIGLNRNAVIPITAGGRLTGRVGRTSVGLLAIRTDDDEPSLTPATTFSVARLKQDIFRRSSVGLIATSRSMDSANSGGAETYGADGTFAFFNNLSVNTYWAATRTAGPSGASHSYRAQLDYAGDRYGLQVERLMIGEAFNPEVGFVRRIDMLRSYALGRFSPRLRSNRVIRRFSWTAALDHVENAERTRLDTRDIDGEFAIEFQNTERFAVALANSYEFLPQPFRIAPGVTLPRGSYDYSSIKVGHTFGRQRKVSGTTSIERGTFYNGHKTAFVVSGSRVNPSAQLSFEPSYTANWVDLVQGSFTTHLLGTRATYTLTPLMFTSALVQYNSTTHGVSANIRLRWEYQPGSELFVVYNEERNTLGRAFPDLSTRALMVKINRLVRF